ncbi:MAG: sensor histidine kinase [Candidatus Limnocylindrales bacterium]|jgi:signal transduction histidine kinase
MQRVLASRRPGSRRLKWNQDYADVVMAVVLTAAGLALADLNNIHLDAISVSLLILQTLPIAWRRRNPMRVLFLVGSAITAYSLLGYHDSSAGLGVFVAFYTVAANEPRRRATIAAAITACGIFISFAAYAAFDSMSGWTSSLTSTYLSFGLAWLIGDNLRVRRAYTRELEERAAELEREREEKAAQAVTEERARIARELHDVVAHYVSVMVVQAAGARRIADKDPIAARGALEAVEAAGRTALAEMRRMLEVLRADDPGMGPQPGLGELERLIDNVRDAGLPVELSIEGGACCLPAGMDLAAYRIVQEALTNSVKHGGKAAARVTIRYTADTLEIEVTDNGRGAAAPLLSSADGGGHGLIGMKERVGLFGGVLEVGPVLTGGYRVFARMPIEADEGARARSEREASRAAIEESAERQREQEHRPHGRAAAPARPRAVPPLMVRVVPPRHAEGERHHGRREQEGEL